MNALRFCLLGLLLPLAATARGADAPAIDEVPKFSRHVAAVFSKLGCNGGTCHGAVQGKNGFRLSLFAADPATDHEHLVLGSRGRRISLAAPEQSLLLQKPTMQVAHKGGRVLERESPEYAILRRWIAAGAPKDDIEASHVVKLEVTPNEQSLAVGQSAALKVKATFADGSSEDVTAICRFESLSSSVASIDTTGKITAQGVGDAAIVVRYRAEPTTTLVIVPHSASEPYPKIDEAQLTFIDKPIVAKLRRLNVPPAPLCDDATFLRRLNLDVCGELPAPQEVREFLADKSPDKRAKKIDELLTRPGHAALWTLKFCDILKASQFGVYADALKTEDDAPRFQAWIRARLEENTPYDELASRILLATSREGRSLDDWQSEVVGLFDGFNDKQEDLEVYKKRKTLDLYWQRAEAQGLPGALQVAHSFLGLRMECAQCHRHPHDVWKQDDLLSFANFFTRVRKVGFQGDNEKKYPEVAARFKALNEESKKTVADATKMKGQTKDFEQKLKDAQGTKDPAKIAAAQKELEDFKNKANFMEKHGKNLEEVARRMMQAEVRHLSEGSSYASITSPLGTQKSETFRLLGESENLKVDAKDDPREKFVAWLKQPDNPYFAKAIVNRIWAHYFGRGIIHPPDDLSPLNPPSHPELLAELCREFVSHKYDLRWLHRQILLSQTYQRDSQASAATALDRTNFAYYYFRRLPAEVLIDAIDQTTGTSELMGMKFYHWPDKMRTVEIPYTPQNAYITFMLRQFGRPNRASSVQCDCERDSNASVLQVLSLANHPRIWEKLADPKGQVARIAKEVESPEEQIREVFLCTVSRLPADNEMQAAKNFLQQAASPAEGLQGVMWSLLNTREFLLQH